VALPHLPPDRVADALRTSDEHIAIERVAGYDIIESWDRDRSGTHFYRFRVDPTGDEVLVKTGADWTGSDARAYHEAQKELARLVSAAQIPSAGPLAPLGWVDSPPLLVMPFIEGTDLVTLLRMPDAPEWGSMSEWISAAGAMLAVFHQSHPVAQGVDAKTVLDDVRSSAGRMRIASRHPEAVIGRIDVQESSVGGYGDFGPGNLLGGEDGRVYLLDPPVEQETALFHRDIGNFLFELRRQLAGHGYTRTKGIKGRFQGLREAFLEGYLAHAPINRFSAADLGLIALFEMRRAAGLARKRFPLRPGDVAWFAGSAMTRRREFKRLAAQSE